MQLPGRWNQSLPASRNCSACRLEIEQRNRYTPRPLMRGGAVWQLVGLITRRSYVQILPPLPHTKTRTGITGSGFLLPRFMFALWMALPQGRMPWRPYFLPVQVGLQFSCILSRPITYKTCGLTLFCLCVKYAPPSNRGF